MPGPRAVEATLDEPDDGAETCIVACPPHPQYGGHRGDRRLGAISDYLVERGIAVLRFDYGSWDEGRAEREDAKRALAWAAERFDRVGLVGFSFGGAMAAAAAATTDLALCVTVLLAPAAQVEADLGAAAAIAGIDAPLRVVHGTRDSTAEWEPYVEAATERGASIVALAADHFFVGQAAKVGAAVGEFVVEHCGD